ncbi:collagen-like protein, partial [Lewinella sp. W8]|uniref:collagen-like triple helix repeat-containing protein n=1 Tax=Lewinella sp. W8 TaxID=2528208 RepID=UPI001566D627
WDTPITTSPSFYTTANAWEIGVNDSAFYRVKINVNFNRNPATNANFYDVYLIENSSGLIVDGSVQQSVFEINGSGFNFSNVNWSTSINGTFFLNGGETYSVRSNQNQDWEDCSISLEKVATQITIPIGPPGQQGEPGPASTVPGPPGPAGEDGFGIQLIG